MLCYSGYMDKSVRDVFAVGVGHWCCDDFRCNAVVVMIVLEIVNQRQSALQAPCHFVVDGVGVVVGTDCAGGDAEASE